MAQLLKYKLYDNTRERERERVKPLSGFTLIELLVVIVIIAILATLAFVAIGSARAKARDAKRIADIKQLQTALELYSMDAGSYPAEITPGQPLEYDGKVYMKKVPSNPVPWIDGACTGNNDYDYTVMNGGTSYAISYCLANGSGDLGSGSYNAIPGNIGSSCTQDCSATCTGQADPGCGKICTVGGATAVAPATISVLSTGSGTATLTWSAVPGATQYKIYRNTTTNPTTAHPTSPTVTGTTLNDTGLSTTAGTTYYYRIIATVCGADSAYSSNASFAVPYAECSIATCGDCSSTVCGTTCSTTITRNGVAGISETYGTVQAGTQCWMTKNINVGTMVSSGVYSNDSLIERWCYNDNSTNCDTDGALYVWNEAMYLPASAFTGIFTGYTGSGAVAKRQGVCPKGWHIPSDAEWGKLEKLLDSGITDTIFYYADQAGLGGNTGYRGTAATADWTNGVGAKLLCTGSGLGYGGASLAVCTAAAGSTAAPKFPLAGTCYGVGSFVSRGTATTLWSSSQTSSGSAWARLLNGASSQIARNDDNRIHSNSVRCLKD